ncbi:MAG: zf-HC2 domain-containing protein [Motiliproteus sp.]
MLKCRDIAEQASEYLEHEMTFSQRLQYRTHLFMCRHCRRFNRQFAAAVAMTRRLPQGESSTTQIDAIKQRLEELH